MPDIGKCWLRNNINKINYQKGHDCVRSLQKLEKY